MTKLAMRRAWFQVHKWIGLTLAILIIPLSLSGSALVWHEPVDRMLNPTRYAVSGTTLTATGAYVGAARAVLAPGERIASLTLPKGSGPVVVAASQPPKRGAAGRPSRTMIFLDPPTARVLDRTDSASGIMRTVHILHGSLLVPGVGRKIVGWIGVAMMFSCFTGLWLWWPTVGKWARGLRWRRHRNLDTNLHHFAGFWIALPLFVLSLTGAWISFPAFFGALSGAPARSEGRGPPRGAPPQPLETPRQNPATVANVAQAHIDAPLAAITWPTTKERRWTVALRGVKQEIEIDDASNSIAAITPVRPHGGSGIAGLMRRLHDGDGMGPVWQTIVFIGGLLPALLAVTGVIMWWRARSWRDALASRQRADRVAAAE